MENIEIFGYTYPELAQHDTGDAVLKAFLTEYR